jgi:formate dehydrogenase assembly factor FdhD
VLLTKAVTHQSANQLAAPITVEVEISKQHGQLPSTEFKRRQQKLRRRSGCELGKNIKQQKSKQLRTRRGKNNQNRNDKIKLG